MGIPGGWFPTPEGSNDSALPHTRGPGRVGRVSACATGPGSVSWD